MKIELIERHQINQEKWNILNSSSNTPFFTSLFYLDTVWSNWSALVIGDYEACFPVRIKSILGKKMTIHPLFVTKLELLGNQDYLPALTNYLNDNYAFVHLFVGEDFRPYIKNFKTRIYQVLELKKHYEDLKKSFSQNAKRLISRFDKSDCSINSNTDIDRLEILLEFFKIQKGHIYKNINAKSIQILNVLIRKANELGKIQIIEATFNGSVCAFGIFLIEHGKALYLKGTVNDIGKENGAMYKVFDTFLKKNSMDIELLDFGGSNDKGLSEFNRKFGAKDFQYINMTYNHMPFVLSSLLAKRYKIN